MDSFAKSFAFYRRWGAQSVKLWNIWNSLNLQIVLVRVQVTFSKASQRQLKAQKALKPVDTLDRR